MIKSRSHGIFPDPAKGKRIPYMYLFLAWEVLRYTIYIIYIELVRHDIDIIILRQVCDKKINF